MYKTRVSIIIPMRNEQKHIARCLNAILAQDYPRDLIEVICVDGMSDDGTREIVESFGPPCSSIRLLDNPKQTAPAAMNIGIRASHGDIVIRVDSRCFISTDYVRQCVEHLHKTGAWNVGGRQQAEAQDNLVSRLIAMASTSPFGMGGAKFRYSDKAQYVDTVYLGAYPKWVLEKVGLYDESLVRNQDYELNYRVRAAGGSIYFTPKIRSVYYGRTSLKKLWKQFFQYGFWKTRVLYRHPASLKPRHLVAPAFVLALVVGLLSCLFAPGRILFASILLSYTVTSLFFSLRATTQAKSRLHLLLLPVVFASMHLSWGLGFWWGLLALAFRPHLVPGSGARG
jgi:glycosyltransferase involved in cell wall biosynthesis